MATPSRLDWTIAHVPLSVLIKGSIPNPDIIRAVCPVFAGILTNDTNVRIHESKLTIRGLIEALRYKVGHLDYVVDLYMWAMSVSTEYRCLLKNYMLLASVPIVMFPDLKTPVEVPKTPVEVPLDSSMVSILVPREDEAAVRRCLAIARYTRLDESVFVRDLLAGIVEDEVVRKMIHKFKSNNYDNIYSFWDNTFGDFGTREYSKMVYGMYGGVPKCKIALAKGHHSDTNVRSVYDRYPIVSREEIAQLVSVGCHKGLIRLVAIRHPEVAKLDTAGCNARAVDALI